MCAMASSACCGPAAQLYLPERAYTARARRDRAQGRAENAAFHLSAYRIRSAVVCGRRRCGRTTSASPRSGIRAAPLVTSRCSQGARIRVPVPPVGRCCVPRQSVLRAATEVATVHVSPSAECCNCCIGCMAAYVPGLDQRRTFDHRCSDERVECVFLPKSLEQGRDPDLPLFQIPGA